MNEWMNKWKVRKQGRKALIYARTFCFLHSNCHNNIWFEQESPMDAKNIG